MLNRRKDDKLPMRIWKWFRGFLMFIGFSVLMGIAFFINNIMEEHSISKERVILTYNFDGSIPESQESLNFGKGMFDESIIFYELILALNNAATDKRVSAFVARIDDTRINLAQIQELRRAVALFRNSGKKAYIFSEDMGLGNSGMGEYYLASAFNEIWLQPIGSVALRGVSIELPFFKNMLDKIGAEPDFLRNGKYKTFTETFERTDMSEDHREMMNALLKDIENQIFVDIAKSRSIDDEQFSLLVKGKLYTDSDSLELKLVDKIGYYDELVSMVVSDTKLREDDLISVEEYFLQSNPAGKFKELVKGKGKNSVALIMAEGDISSKSGGRSSVSMKSAHIISADINKSIKNAIEDENVKVIILRLSTPGGSATSSEAIRRYILKAKEKGKPVIVSMGGYATSGGYWIASAANKIIAENGTITGSIGVFSGKPVLEKLWEKIGLTWDSVSISGDLPMWSPNRKFSEEEKKRLSLVIDSVYYSFLNRVQDGRKMTSEEVDKLAEGRVFTGLQAKNNGLVDAIGGFGRALDEAKIAIGLTPEDSINIIFFPEKKSPFKLFVEFLTTGAFVMPNINIKEIFTSLITRQELLKI